MTANAVNVDCESWTPQQQQPPETSITLHDTMPDDVCRGTVEVESGLTEADQEAFQAPSIANLWPLNSRRNPNRTGSRSRSWLSLMIDEDLSPSTVRVTAESSRQDDVISYSLTKYAGGSNVQPTTQDEILRSISLPNLSSNNAARRDQQREMGSAADLNLMTPPPSIQPTNWPTPSKTSSLNSTSTLTSTSTTVLDHHFGVRQRHSSSAVKVLVPLVEPIFGAPRPNGEDGTAPVDLNSAALTQLQNVVWVQVSFNKIGEVNTLTHRFDADIIIKIKWLKDSLTSTPDIFVENAINEPVRKVDESVEQDSDGNVFTVHRIKLRGTFFQRMLTYEFPFDIQDLSVTVKTHSDVILRDDSEHHVIHQKNFIDVQEYYLYKYIESYYDGQIPPSHQHFHHKRERPSDDTHNMLFFTPDELKRGLVVSGKVARRFGFYILSAFFILFCLFLLSIDVMFENANALVDRMKHGMMLMTASIALKLATSALSPRSPHMNFLDGYHFACILFLFCVLVWTAIESAIVTNAGLDVKNSPLVIDTAGLVFYCAAVIIYHAWYIMLIVIGPYSTRRDMARREITYKAQHRARKID